MDFDALLASASKKIALTGPGKLSIPDRAILSLRCCHLIYRAVPNLDTVFIRAFAFKGQKGEYDPIEGFYPLSDMIEELNIAKFGGRSHYGLTDEAEEMVRLGKIEMWISHDLFSYLNSKAGNPSDPESLAQLYLIPASLGIPDSHIQFPSLPWLKIPFPAPLVSPYSCVRLRASLSIMEPTLFRLMSKEADS